MRRVFRISGADRLSFLNGLTTRDVPQDSLGYAALLTPQGKFLADFFLWQDKEAVFLDVAEDMADDLLRRLAMYRLRAAVEIAPTDLKLQRGTANPPEGAMADPRSEALGWRAYGDEAYDDGSDWVGLRVSHGIPAAGHELVPGESYILELGFERLNGVDFRKGCFVGQEIVARMKHKTTLRKGLATIAGTDLVEGQEIKDAGGKPVGVVHSVAEGRALAYLRFDRAEGVVEVIERWV